MPPDEHRGDERERGGGQSVIEAEAHQVTRLRIAWSFR